MGNWQLQDAKARFSKLIDETLKKGAQIVTRRGVETVAVVPIDQWRRLQHAARPSLRELLLSESGRFDIALPPRGRLRRRAVPEV